MGQDQRWGCFLGKVRGRSLGKGREQGREAVLLHTQAEA